MFTACISGVEGTDSLPFEGSPPSASGSEGILHRENQGQGDGEQAVGNKCSALSVPQHLDGHQRGGTEGAGSLARPGLH